MTPEEAVPPPPVGGRVAAHTRKQQQGLQRRRRSAKPLSHSQLRRLRRWGERRRFEAAIQPSSQDEGRLVSAVLTGTVWSKRFKALLCCCLLLCVVPALAGPEALTGLPLFTSNLALWELSHVAGYRFRAAAGIEAAPNIASISPARSAVERGPRAGSICSRFLPFLPRCC